MHTLYETIILFCNELWASKDQPMCPQSQLYHLLCVGYFHQNIMRNGKISDSTPEKCNLRERMIFL